MRFLLAGLIFVGASLSLIFGISHRAGWDPASEVRLSLNLAQPVPYVYLDSEFLSSYGTEPTLTARGFEGEAVVVQGREADLEAFLDDSNYSKPALRVDSDPNPETNQGADLYAVTRSGESPAPAVFGLDIFYEQEVFEGAILKPISVEPGIGYLIGSSSSGVAASSLTFSWPQPPQDPGGEGFLIAGAAGYLLSLGLVVLELIAQSRRRGPGRRHRGPKLPKPTSPWRAVKSNAANNTPKLRGRRALSVAVVPLLALSLSGCVAEYVDPSLSPTPIEVSDDPTASLTQGQLEKILGDLEEVLAVADQERNRELLETRVAGPALISRAAEYTLLQRSAEVTEPSVIFTAPVSLFLPARTNLFPRTAFAVTGDAANEQLQMLVLLQESPRDNYKLWYNINLLPSPEFPEVAASDVGAAPITLDNAFLKIPTDQLVTALGDVIDNGNDSSYVSLIDPNNRFVLASNQAQQSLRESLETAEISFSHELGDPVQLALGTINAGALVATFMTDSTVIRPTETGEAIAVEGAEGALLGAEGSPTGIETSYGSMLLFYVPNAQSESRVRLLGATQVLLSVDRLEEQDD